MKVNSILIASKSETIAKLTKIRLEGIGFNGCTFLATTDDDILNVLKNKEPDVLLLEACFFNDITDRKIQQLTEKFLPTRIVVYSVVPCDVYKVVRFFRCGADSYINIREGLDVYENKLRSIIQGKSIVPEIVLNSKWDLDHLPPENNDTKERDKEIMELVAQGIESAVIGEILGLSERTVKNRRYMLYEKLGCHNLAELLQKSVRNNIIDKRKYCGCVNCNCAENNDTQEVYL